MIALENGLVPVLHRAITRTTADFLQIGPRETTSVKKILQENAFSLGQHGSLVMWIFYWLKLNSSYGQLINFN